LAKLIEGFITSVAPTKVVVRLERTTLAEIGLVTSQRSTSLKKGISISGWILWVPGGHVFLGLSPWAVWLVTHDEAWIRYFFDYQSALFLHSSAG
jgi:hypothetical protein